jgi:hypothetical protein
MPVAQQQKTVEHRDTVARRAREAKARALAMKRGELKRKTELKRGDTQLRADPAKTAAWRKRSAKALPARSAQRIEDTPERQALVRRKLSGNPMCEAQIPFCCTKDSTEVNEIIRRSQWAAGFLVESNTEGLCHNCHAWITVHPDWARHHGHQLEGSTRDLPTYSLHVAAAGRARAVTVARCDVDCAKDHAGV